MTATTHAIDVATQIADRVRQHLGPQKYSMWFDRTARFEFLAEQGTVQLTVPTRFAADWIGRHFAKSLASAITEVVGDDAAMDIRVQPAQFPKAGTGTGNGTTPQAAADQPGAPANTQPAAHDAVSRRGYLRDAGGLLYRTPGSEKNPRASAANPFRHRLDRYVTGPSNQLAYAAAARMADLADPTANHPLFLHGICGVGKTHLLQGICRAALEQKPNAKVLYFTGEQFTNQFITAVRENKLDAFRRRMRRLDLLAIDDIHFIANKDKTQQEFLHCFEENDLAGARVLLASDRHPRQIAQFSEALVSRCVRGLVIEVAEPDAVTRKSIIAELASRRGLFLQPAVIELLAQRYDGSVRDLEGAIARLHALATLTDQPSRKTATQLIPVGRALVEQLPDFATPLVRRPVRFETIRQVVCEHLMIEPKQLANSSRHKHLVLGRSLTVWLARDLTSMSYPEIAHAMGRKNHSTVITACQRLEKQIAADQQLLLPGADDQTTPRALTELLRRRVLRAGVV